jgi:hypothetical protein
MVFVQDNWAHGGQDCLAPCSTGWR